MAEPNMKNEYSERFDQLRKNRVEMSFHKYGPAKTNFKDKLVDAANYLMFEFMYPQLDGAYFKATDSDESAGTVGEAIGEWGL